MEIRYVVIELDSDIYISKERESERKRQNLLIGTEGRVESPLELESAVARGSQRELWSDKLLIISFGRLSGIVLRDMFSVGILSFRLPRPSPRRTDFQRLRFLKYRQYRGLLWYLGC